MALRQQFILNECISVCLNDGRYIFFKWGKMKLLAHIIYKKKIKAQNVRPKNIKHSEGNIVVIFVMSDFTMDS